MVTSEAVTYRRIISERQNSHDGDDQQQKQQDNNTSQGIISRWSTPPKFGLSPPGNSRLAKRRSLKQKLSALSLTGLSSNAEELNRNGDSNNSTPVQSPSVGTPMNERIFTASGKNGIGPFSDSKLFGGPTPPNKDINKSPPAFSSGNSTPVATPRNEHPPLKIFDLTK